MTTNAKPTTGRRTADGYRFGAWHQMARADDETVRLARKMRELEGKTYVEIAAATGQPWLTVRDWCTYRTRLDA